MIDNPILKISNLTKQYGVFTAVDNVSFEIASGQIIGLLGPNGAGKTTTINMMLGILLPSGGTIEILGMELRKHRSEISKRVNFAAVYAHLPPNLTVYQNLYIFGLLYEVKDLKHKVQQMLAEFDLENFTYAKTGMLSSGELSRLNLAKAVMNDPALLLLDEPTTSLDPSIAQLIREKIKDYTVRNKVAVLWTSHNMREIEAVCQQVHFLSRGKILLSGNPKTLAAEHRKKDLEDLFITIAREPLSLS